MSLEHLREDRQIERTISEGVRNLSKIEEILQIMQMTRIKDRENADFIAECKQFSIVFNIPELDKYANDLMFLWVSLKEGKGRQEIVSILKSGLQAIRQKTSFLGSIKKKISGEDEE